MSNKGAYDSDSLREIADYLDELNKPIHDDYDKYCEESLNCKNNS